MTPEALRTARLALGLNQRQTAALLGLSPARGGQHVSDMETGKRAVTDTIARLMLAYVDGYRPPDWP